MDNEVLLYLYFFYTLCIFSKWPSAAHEAWRVYRFVKQEWFKTYKIPSFMCTTARTHIFVHVKDPRSICRKRVGLSQTVVWSHKITAHTRLVVIEVG